MSPMMQSSISEGNGSSGFGVELRGFFSSSSEAATKIMQWSALKGAGPYDKMAMCESEGGFFFVYARNPESVESSEAGPLKTAVFRREIHRFFLDLEPYLAKLKAAWIADLSVSAHGGSLTMAILYREGFKDGVHA